jgi:putative ABC transport system permease protein
MMMPAALQLAINTLWRKPVKPLLTVLVIAAAVALVMTACGVLSSMKASLRHNLSAVLGQVDARITPITQGADSALPTGILKQAAALHEVQYAAGRAMAFARIRIAGHSEPAHLIVGSYPAAGKIIPPMLSQGGPLTSPSGQVLLNASLAQRLHAHVGMTAVLLGPAGSQQVRIAGLVQRSAVQRYFSFPSAYVTGQTLTKLTGEPPRWTRIDIKFRHGITDAAGVAALKKTLGPGVKIRSMGKSRKPFAPMQQLLSRLRWLIAIPTALGAGLLILAVFAVGMQERVRFFGQLRCIGAARAQVALTALVESLLPMGTGIALGLMGGVAAAWMLVHHLHHGHFIFHLGYGSVLIAGLAGLLAAGIGVALPVLKAWRVTPMAAVGNIGRSGGSKSLWPALWVGLGALSLQILLWQIPNPIWALWAYVVLGGPLVLLAAAALAPVTVAAMERWLKRPLAWLWQVEPAFFSTAAAPYRAGMMAAALLAAISFFVSMRARGIGLLESWEFPAQFPDAFVFSPITPLSYRRASQIPRHVNGVTGVSALTAFWIPARIGNAGEQQVLFVAVEPQSFLRMLGVHFVQGNQAAALQAMQAGSGVLVAGDALRSLGLAAGKSLEVGTLAGVKRLTVAGVVTSPGVSIAQSFLRVRQAFHQAAAVALIGTLAQAKKYFGINGPNLVMLTLKPSTSGMKAVAGVKAWLTSGGKQSFLGRLLNFQRFALHGTSVRRMKRELDDVITRVMRALSLAALGGMLLAAIAVAAMAAAAVRQRRYEFGILRAVGAGRWQLLRMVLAELSIIVISAIVLGCALGQYLAYMGTLVDHRVSGFDSRYAWAISAMVLAGAVAATATLAAGLIPAWRAAIVGVRSLLAPGRE